MVTVSVGGIDLELAPQVVTALDDVCVLSPRLFDRASLASLLGEVCLWLVEQRIGPRAQHEKYKSCDPYAQVLACRLTLPVNTSMVGSQTCALRQSLKSTKGLGVPLYAFTRCMPMSMPSPPLIIDVLASGTLHGVWVPDILGDIFGAQRALFCTGYVHQHGL